METEIILPKIKNKELYNTLLELSRTCSQYYYKHNVTKTSIFSQYYFPMSDHDKEIISFIDHSDCAKIFIDIPEIKKMDKKSIGTISQRQHLDNTKTCLLTFIKELSNQFPGGHLPQEGFDQSYEKFEEFIYEDFIELGYVSRLYNFKLEGIEEIVFTDNLKVSYAPLSHSERMEAFSNSNPNISDYIIEAKVKFRKIVGEEGIDEKEGPRSFNYFYHVINAFKLLKPGSVSHDKILVKPITFYPFGKGNMWYNLANVSWGENCIIKAEDKDFVLNLFNYLLSKEETDRNTFNIALGRFSMGISRNNTIDKLIDFMIGLESLYLPDDNSELVFKLSLRIAFLLNDNRENAKSDFEFVKKMYGKRSRVVHGDKSDITGAEIKNIEDILRKSLHLYIKEPKKFSKEYLRKDVYFS